MTTQIKRFAVLGVMALAFGLGSGVANATSLPFSTNALNEMDHGAAYTWRIDNIDLKGQAISGATLTITGLANWDNSANIIHIWLFDTASSADVTSANDSDDRDFFKAVGTTVVYPRSRKKHLNPLIADNTLATLLDEPHGFSPTPTTYSYSLDTDELKALSSYIANGKNIALAFDPDCHYWDGGVSFNIDTKPVPEPASLTLLGMGLVGVGGAIRRRRAR